MTTIHSCSFLCCALIIFTFYIFINCQDVAKLPYCNDKIQQKELIFVSTLDGSFTALTNTGDVSWQIDTGPGPLLTSNIHKLELTNNGQWLRIIPSLSGSLYKFDGITIDPIPINAETLLTSSFRYSDDLVIAGGREVRTYGVLLNSGKHIYECSLGGCKNTTNYSDDFDDIVIIERKSHTVHAVEPRTGLERWNFSVGQHNIKIPYINCIDMNLKNSNLNISAIVPEGLLMARNSEKVPEILWKYKFEAPIVAVWTWNGRELKTVNLFNSVVSHIKSGNGAPSIYVGMHNKQLYVHESSTMQDILHLKQDSSDRHSVVESKSLTRIPWKPISATSVSTNINEETDDSTALSVLYASEYVNGNGYYLYTEEKAVCDKNITNTISVQKSNPETSWYRWKEAFAIALTTVIICNVIYNYAFLKFGWSKKSEQAIIPRSSQNVIYEHSSSHSESSDTVFTSRYISEFEPISCLGKGGFGVVFQAKKKFDECDYAIKRITLPNKPSARDRMMREVKALAKLDHTNIVRYYNAWLESPPHDWHQEHDRRLIDPSTSCLDKSPTTRTPDNKRNLSLAIDMESDSHSFLRDDDAPYKGENYESSSIVFQSSSTVATSLHVSNSCDTISKSESETSEHCSYPQVIYNERPPPVYLYIQMQLCCKESLKDWLYNNPKRTRLEVLNIFQQIVDAVEYVHFRGLIHRDLKPSNIFFSLEGQIKVGDFGLVTSIKEYDGNKENQSNSFLQESYTNAVGTHLYMSPEQLEGSQYDHKVDIYSLGIIFFELLVVFQTEMERISVLTDLRKNIYPKEFAHEFDQECELLSSMLATDSGMRPAASEVKSRLSLENIIVTI